VRFIRFSRAGERAQSWPLIGSQRSSMRTLGPPRTSRTALITHWGFASVDYRREPEVVIEPRNQPCRRGTSHESYPGTALCDVVLRRKYLGDRPRDRIRAERVPAKGRSTVASG